MQEKPLLLLDDLRRHLDDRLLALVERLDQPVGAGEAVSQPSLTGAFARLGRKFGIVTPIDQQTRQGGAVDLHRPAVLDAADEDIGDHRGRVVRGKA